MVVITRGRTNMGTNRAGVKQDNNRSPANTFFSDVYVEKRAMV